MSPRSLAVLVVLVAAAACKKAKSAAPGAAGGAAGGFPPTPVEVAAAIRDTVVDAIQATGQIEAVQSTELRPEVSGRITEILVREGQPVASGTPLFKVDDAELKAQVAQAQAERDLAQRGLERTKQLIAQNAASQADLENADATARSKEASYDLLRTRLERTVVRAPFAGVAGRRLVSIGDYVTPQTPLISLQSVNPQYAVLQVPERYADRLRLGQLVSFQVGALPGKNFSGEVAFVDPVVELPGRTILIKARVPNPERQLQAGMFIEARLATDIRPNAIVVPEDALLPLGGATYVWVIKEGKADRREVTVGVRTAGWAEIHGGGIEAGDQVVVGGLERLFPNAPVMPQVVQRSRRPPAAQESTATKPARRDSAAAGAARPADPPPAKPKS
ncbi:MAG TPA: efflux RND transporter periplasmic adaptor subunit [Gemmatimonadales bacterium]|nr:efflux RND transporter periplasmic adaptor subunit [Gemmatimonadales bacterium]